MFRFKKVIATLALCVVGATSAHAATLVNGSLTGPVQNGILAGSTPDDALPDGWVNILGNADTMDENNNIGFTAFDVPFNSDPSGASPDGGTWVGFGNDRVNAFDEVFGQTVSDFVIGQTYMLAWYGANFGGDLTSFGDQCFCETNGIFAAVDGAIIGAGADLVSGPDWVEQAVVFQATSTTHMLAFGLTGNGPSYLSIDGIQLTSVAAIPLPAGAALLVSGIGAFGIARRRRRKA